MGPKKTKYLHTHSHHHPTQKSAILKTLITQAIWILDPRALNKEKYHLTKSSVANGYSIAQINKEFFSSLWPRSKKNPPPYSSPLTLVSLPCIQGINDHISRLLTKNIIKTLFKPYITLNKCSYHPRKNLTPCLAKVFTRSPSHVTNHTLAKQEDPPKPS
jgi:hypothetical protein